jgi:hypothetical protein
VDNVDEVASVAAISATLVNAAVPLALIEFRPEVRCGAIVFRSNPRAAAFPA